MGPKYCVAGDAAGVGVVAGGVCGCAGASVAAPDFVACVAADYLQASHYHSQ